MSNMFYVTTRVPLLGMWVTDHAITKVFINGTKNWMKNLGPNLITDFAVCSIYIESFFYDAWLLKTCGWSSLLWSCSGEEETANFLLGKFKWGHAFMSLNGYGTINLYNFVIFTLFLLSRLISLLIYMRAQVWASAWHKFIPTH